MAEMRATYRRRGNGWEGVVKDAGGAIVAVCGHYHHNRDQYTSLRGPSARDCAYELLNKVTGDPTAAAKARGWFRFQ